MADANAWPPEPFNIAFDRYRELVAWWSGDTTTLHEIYSGQAATHTVNGRAHRGGVVGTLSKWWWGQPVPADEQRMRVHAPLAADLCGLSADLLFGEPPQVVYRRPEEDSTDATTEKPKKRWQHPAQPRLDAIFGSNDAHSELLIWGEYAAALGGAYLAVAWDLDVDPEHVFLKAYAADVAIPTFRHGRLVSVRLWTEYKDGNVVYRLVEQHDPGTVEYSLYRGTTKSLGELVPISERPETAHYESMRSEADLQVAIANPGALPLSVRIGTGSSRLAVAYMPNAMPVPDWRKLGPLAHLGRSDLDGIQDLLDKYDQVWSSLARDVDNGQGRIIVSEDVLDLSGKPGEGASFDSYRQVFTAVGASLGKAADGGAPITDVQFDIRWEEHIKVLEALKREIGSRLGYSEAHLGLDNAKGAQTATEITADLSDSERTRDKKAIYARAALSSLAIAALEIDFTVFGGDDLGDITTPPSVTFSPLSQADPEKLARIAALQEGIASLTERVRVQRPQWDDEEIAAEVEEIKAERAALAVPDPATFTGDPFEGDADA